VGKYSELDALRLICSRAALALSENPALALRFLKIGCACAALGFACYDKRAEIAKLTSLKLKAARIQPTWNWQRTILGLTLITVR
jgi:hypothetical protein